MKHGRWGCCKWMCALSVWSRGLLVVMFLFGQTQAQESVHVLKDAQAELEPEGMPTWSGEVMLPHLWDKAFPGRNGRGRYRLELPPVMADGTLWGLYFPRIGNQVEIYVGGDLLLQRGNLGDGHIDTTHSPLWVPVPARLLSASAPTVLEVRLATQPMRWGGLAAPRFGPQAILLPQYRERYVWRQWSAVAVVLALGLTGGIAAGLWHLQREPVYGYFALCAPFGMLRYADRLWDTAPLGWPVWGGIVAFSLVVHVLLLIRFALALLGRDDEAVRRGFWGLLACEAALMVCAFGWSKPWYWTMGLALLFLPAFSAYCLAVRQAVVTRQAEAVALCLASFVPIAAGFYDFLEIRVATESVGRSSYLPLGTMLFVLLMGWLIVSRYARQTRAYQGLRDSLDEKVRLREQELRESYALLQHEHAQRAALVERQRIMRDIHDGVGSQLVGLLSLIGKSRTSHQQLREHVNAALDELRMAVDAMQTGDGDLDTVLATLRYRLQPRLAATGIQVEWQLEELPPVDHLTPHTVLQIQRILLEAFTNVLRHAQARRIRVTSLCQRRSDGQSQDVELEVADDGVGFGGQGSAQGGQGMANMRARAQAIGAVLEITSAPGLGTRVRIVLPAPTMPATPTPAPAAPAAPSM